MGLTVNLLSIVRGRNVTGQGLAAAMLKENDALAKAWGRTYGHGSDFSGLGDYNECLRKDPGIKAIWQNMTPLNPEQMLARASLNSSWMERTSALFEQTTDSALRQWLFAKILWRDIGGGPITVIDGSTVRRAQSISDDKITEFLTPQKPDQELQMTPCTGGAWLSERSITFSQLLIFMKQTGYKPASWKESKGENPAVGVSYDDAAAFAKWQGRTLPTFNQLLWIRYRRNNVPHTSFWEWASTSYSEFYMNRNNITDGCNWSPPSDQEQVIVRMSAWERPEFDGDGTDVVLHPAMRSFGCHNIGFSIASGQE